MLSVGAICIEDRFCVSRKEGTGEVGGCTILADSAWQLLQLHGYRKDLVRAGWPILLLSCTNERRKQSFHLAGNPFLAL